MIQPKWMAVTMACLGAAASIARGGPVTYALIDLGSDSLGASSANAINQNGEVVGNIGNNGFSYHPNSSTGSVSLNAVNSSGIAVGGSSDSRKGVIVDTAQSSPSPTSVGSFGGPTAAFGINDTGLIVGASQYPTTVGYAFYTQAGTGALTPLTPVAQQSSGSSAIGAAGSTALAVNNAGTIVGFASAGAPSHPFLYTGGKMYDIGTLSGAAGDSGTAYAINTGGTIVGSSDDSDGNLQAFEYSNYATNAIAGTTTGTLTALGFLDPVNNPVSKALGINDTGLIVGDSDDTDGDPHAVEFVNKQVIDLNSFLSPGSGWVLTQAESVNDKGQIVGNGLRDNVEHAFLLQPNATVTAVPLPASSNTGGTLFGLLVAGRFLRSIYRRRVSVLAHV